MEFPDSSVPSSSDDDVCRNLFEADSLPTVTVVAADGSLPAYNRSSHRGNKEFAKAVTEFKREIKLLDTECRHLEATCRRLSADNARLKKEAAMEREKSRKLQTEIQTIAKGKTTRSLSFRKQLPPSKSKFMSTPGESASTSRSGSSKLLSLVDAGGGDMRASISSDSGAAHAYACCDHEVTMRSLLSVMSSLTEELAQVSGEASSLRQQVQKMDTNNVSMDFSSKSIKKRLTPSKSIDRGVSSSIDTGRTPRRADTDALAAENQRLHALVEEQARALEAARRDPKMAVELLRDQVERLHHGGESKAEMVTISEAGGDGELKTPRAATQQEGMLEGRLDSADARKIDLLAAGLRKELESLRTQTRKLAFELTPAKPLLGGRVSPNSKSIVNTPRDKVPASSHSSLRVPRTPRQPTSTSLHAPRPA